MLELAPITLLVGENNSGKSSIMQALHLPALTLQSEDPGVCLKLLHQDYDYGSFEDLVFRHNKKESLTLSFKAEFLLGEKREHLQATLRLTYGYLPKRKEIYLSKLVIEDSEGERLNIYQGKYSDSRKVLIRNYNNESPHLSRLFVRDRIVFMPRLDPFDMSKHLQKKYGKKKGTALFEEIALNARLSYGFISLFRKVHYLGPIRVPASRTYLHTGELTDRVGRRGEQALQIYSALLKRKKREDLKKLESIKEALYQLGFIEKLTIRKIETRHYEFWTRHKESALDANLADTGFGTSQVLPVIVSLYTLPPGSTLLFEQPEIHLHPAGQAELGSVFAKACTPEKRIVIETHSENLILRIQTEVAKGNLKPEFVRIYYIQPKKTGHEVVLIPLNKKGEFMTEWPKGFFEENYQESLKLSKARRGG